MHIPEKGFFSVLLGSLTVLVFISPALISAHSHDQKGDHALSSPSSSTDAPDLSVHSTAHQSDAGRSTPTPGPAWKTISGTVKQIKGDIYIVEDYEENHVQLHVNRETKRLRGQKKVGDRVRAEITRDGFANSIQ